MYYSFKDLDGKFTGDTKVNSFKAVVHAFKYNLKIYKMNDDQTVLGPFTGEDLVDCFYFCFNEIQEKIRLKE